MTRPHRCVPPVRLPGLPIWTGRVWFCPACGWSWVCVVGELHKPGTWMRVDLDSTHVIDSAGSRR